YQKKNTVTEHVTGDMLNEHIHICISETENISLLDIPSTLVSVEADDAETILERNRRYAEVACRNRMGRDNYMDQAVQTLNGAAKNKQTQSDGVVMVDTATTVTNWDLYNTWIRPEQHEAVCSPEPERVDGPAASLKASRGSEMSVSVGSTASTGNSEGRDALLLLNAESDLQWIKLSEKFQDCVRLMEKTVLRNTFQPKFAAYRHLPILEDADQQVESGKVDVKEDTKGPHPALECLWAFSCELTRGRSVSSMALNKKNPDLLAVGYGEFDSSNQKPGLVCCWSFKNPMWPDHVIHCDSTVTSLDFSSNNPSQLAVGMLNGVITIYNVQNQNSKSSSQCYRKHLGPVWQIRWIQQQLRLTGEEKVEALISAAEDGRISKWFLSNNGLDCTDLMKLRKDIHTKKKTTENKTEERTEIVLSALTPGLSLDFHPTDSSIYLVGTGEGLIHKCSSSNSQQFLETYWKHFCPVTCVSWSPLSPDVFLSCSSDWTIHLWRQDHFCPVLSFTSTHRAVYDIKWSPKWATVFGVISEGQMQIWDLNSSILDPIIVQSAGPGETMTSLLFPSQTDCVLVGDSDGQVTVYQLHNLQRESNQVKLRDKRIPSMVLPLFTSL
uniref:Dynein axonemal intermediate chain 4 n=1 Tax=Mola mola TaxID=94237 RepID=A0A3Q3XBA1_MOLML